MKKQEEISNYCAYCDTLTFQEVYVDEKGDRIVICKTCNMEAAQLILFPHDSKKDMTNVMNKLRTGY
jgi:hypothetical protein